jgi:deoxyribonuclease-4
LISLGVAKLYSAELPELLTLLQQKAVDRLEIGFASTVPTKFPRSFVERARNLHVDLSCHLPFGVNLGAETEKSRSVAYLTQGLRIANVLGGLAVFHPGFYRGQPFEELQGNLQETIRLTLAQVPSGDGMLGIETTGKTTEIGTIDEILSLVKEIDNKSVVPVIDCAHVYARTQGKFPRTVHDFNTILNRVREELGPERLYFHMSGIEYRKGGEWKHLSVKTCTPPLPYLLHALKQNKIDCQMILESPDPVGDVDWVRTVLEEPRKWFAFAEEQQRKSKMNLMDAYL